LLSCQYRLPGEKWNEKQVLEIAMPCSGENSISPGTDAVKALSLMNQTGSSGLLFTEGDRLAGVVTLKDVLKSLFLRVELGS
jgi:high-affinity K+ transport system ATPase subunit B